MERREFLKAAALGAAACLMPRELLAAAAAQPARKPNIIFILSDDVGLGDVGCFGGDHYKTPKIDALAASGIKFTQCYAEPLCGPSRCEIMTGRYPFRTGMISNQTGPLLKPANEIMLPTVLKQAGYVTAQVGKWNQLPLEPSDWGFGEYLRFKGSGQYWSKTSPTYTENGETKTLPEGTYLPDVMHDFLADFITRHRNEPFYVHYCMSHIHGQIVRTPDTVAGSDLYTDNIDYMDKLVGKLIAALDNHKLREKTLIVFVGDNGTAPPRANGSTVHGKRLSGQKGSLLEGGSRVPMIVSWPGTTPAAKVRDDLVDFSDFFPTFAELTGAKLPEGVTIDGHSILPQIKGQKGKPREWLYVELNGKWYARNAGYKLNSAGQLFDLKDAPFAEAPVPADTKDAKAIAARKRLQEVLDKLNPAAGKQSKPGPAGAKARPRARRRNGLGAILGS